MNVVRQPIRLTRFVVNWIHKRYLSKSETEYKPDARPELDFAAADPTVTQCRLRTSRKCLI